MGNVRVSYLTTLVLCGCSFSGNSVRGQASIDGCSLRFLVYLHGSTVGIASSIDSAALTTPRDDFSWYEIMKSLTIG